MGSRDAVGDERFQLRPRAQRRRPAVGEPSDLAYAEPDAARGAAAYAGARIRGGTRFPRADEQRPRVLDRVAAPANPVPADHLARGEPLDSEGRGQPFLQKGGGRVVRARAGSAGGDRAMGGGGSGQQGAGATRTASRYRFSPAPRESPRVSRSPPRRSVCPSPASRPRDSPTPCRPSPDANSSAPTPTPHGTPRS